MVLGVLFIFYFDTHTLRVAVNGNERDPPTEHPLNWKRKFMASAMLLHAAYTMQSGFIYFLHFSDSVSSVFSLTKMQWRDEIFKYSFQTHVDSSVNFPMVDNKFIYYSKYFHEVECWCRRLLHFSVNPVHVNRITEVRGGILSFLDENVLLPKNACAELKLGTPYILYLLTVQGSTSNAKRNQMI